MFHYTSCHTPLPFGKFKYEKINIKSMNKQVTFNLTFIENTELAQDITHRKQ